MQLLTERRLYDTSFRTSISLDAGLTGVLPVRTEECDTNSGTLFRLPAPMSDTSRRVFVWGCCVGACGTKHTGYDQDRTGQISVGEMRPQAIATTRMCARNVRREAEATLPQMQVCNSLLCCCTDAVQIAKGSHPHRQAGVGQGEILPLGRQA